MADTGCLAWRIKNDKKTDSLYQLPFESGFHKNKKDRLRFYLPFRCRDTVLPGQSLCKKCFDKKTSPVTWPPPCGNFPLCYWGLVNEPIRNFGEQINYMAFSPWFLEKARVYRVAPDVLQKAREAWAIATSGLNNIPPLPDMGDNVEIKPKKIKIKVTHIEPLAPAKPVETIKKRVQKKVCDSVAPIAIVMNEKSLEADAVEEIPVIAKELNGTLYYIDTSKSKVYDIKTAKYVGRWDSHRELIVTDRRDSDA